MNDPTKILIYQDDYENLIKHSKFLACLRACGVDSWNGYDDALDMMEGMDDE